MSRKPVGIDENGLFLAPRVEKRLRRRRSVLGLVTGAGASSAQALANTAAINAAIAEISVGGHVVLPEATIKIRGASGRISVPDGVGLLGEGGGDINVGTTLLCDDATAGVDIVGDSGKLADFRVNGNGVANYPIIVGLGAHRVFESVCAMNALLDNWTINKMQNSIFIRCTSKSATRNNWVLDLGCGGLLFSQSTGNFAGQSDLVIKQSGTSAEVYAEPSHITFHHCIFERGAGNYPVADVVRGFEIKFDMCVLQSDLATTASNPMLRIGTGTALGPVIFQDGVIISNNQIGAAWKGIGTGAGAQVVLAGTTAFYGLAYALDATSGGAQVIGQPLLGTGVTLLTPGTPSGGDQSVYRTRQTMDLYDRASASNVAIATKVTADAGQRFRLYADGSLNFGTGAGFAFPVKIGPNSDATAVRIDGSTTQTTTPSAGGAGALPATPAGYMRLNIGGTNRLIPYY